MSLSPNSNALALKRKLQHTENRYDPGKRHHLQESYDLQAPWLYETKKQSGWSRMGNPAVQSSLPLANMVSAVQDLIDPDFDPLTAILDEDPRFLKPLPDCIAPEDVEFLRFRGALSIPESGLRNELLRSYIQWVHSFMPVLNLQELLRCVAENDPNGNVSVLLFQAIMFVGTAFVDLQHLLDAGYATRKDARSAFFTRLRLLYSLDCEEDRIVILQTVLLMTYWSDPENSLQRDIWDWIGVCNIQAQSIGLNTDPSSSNDIDAKTRRLRTRIWWCLYSRDRLIAMGMRRPLQVNEGTCNVPMLRLDDFDFEPFSESAVALFHCRQLEDISHQKRLATMFIEKVKLCQCIGRVLFAQYAPAQRQFGATDRTTVTIVPRQASESEFTRCSQKLDSWLNALPKDAQFIPASKSNFREGEDVLLLHGAMLRMLFHATTSALHRPWAANSKDSSKSRLEWRQTARKKMHDAAAGITHIIQGLNQLNMTRFLPQSGVTVILPAAVAHLSNSMSDNPAVRESSISNFHRCIQVLHCLKDIYPAAKTEFANLEAATKMSSGNPNSNTFFQIMQYNFDPSPSPTNMNPRKYSMAESATGPASTLQEQNKISEQQTSAQPRQRAQSASTPQQNLHERRPSSIAPNNDLSNPISTPRRSFPNDFDDHFAVTENSTMDITSETPFSYLNIDFSAFPNVADPPTQDINLSPSHNDLDSMDWTKALFSESSAIPERDEDLFTRDGRNSNDKGQTQSIHQQEQGEERDLFSFTDGFGDGVQGRHHSLAHASGITGDLDRDLGFQTGDEIF
ncbi:uncharacterized protein N7469_005113 [Penicillium citrinum]|uniref:Xylanolytic transcriptional activator regulatory domain-containing protein n=1 Tax=Penicillium citrinum TaxID=5077 RepID=A0A9W9TP18_PENCI|nr:uncharacterized protein N7469_005113 [Penicillium citrinum]KAJ5233347.1 hypothetical protein N7469_005113 [Penicillium citrinum]